MSKRKVKYRKEIKHLLKLLHEKLHAVFIALQELGHKVKTRDQT